MTPFKKATDELVLNKMKTFMTDVNSEGLGWESTFESLKSFVFEEIKEDDRDIKFKIKFFEKSLESTAAATRRRGNRQYRLPKCARRVR